MKKEEIEVKIERLGKSIYIPEDAMIIDNGEGFNIKYYDRTYSIIIGIGKDYTAELIIHEDDLKALRNGERIHVEEV